MVVLVDITSNEPQQIPLLNFFPLTIIRISRYQIFYEFCFVHLLLLMYDTILVYSSSNINGDSSACGPTGGNIDS
jgi:hypothetical protein